MGGANEVGMGDGALVRRELGSFVKFHQVSARLRIDDQAHVAGREGQVAHSAAEDRDCSSKGDQHHGHYYEPNNNFADVFVMHNAQSTR